MIMYN